jgi:hypothetical protein
MDGDEDTQCQLSSGFRAFASSFAALKGRTRIGGPLIWFPRLVEATDQQRRTWRLIGGGYGIHWPEVDEDISVASLLCAA